ncbi:MAG: RND transporter, partial [Ferruginibacter sp.]|nr:RND transporter [Ferruginibacter sp.]
LSAYIASKPEMNKPLSIAEGMKLGNMAFQQSNNDSSYSLPGEVLGKSFSEKFWQSIKKNKNVNGGDKISKMLNSFMDTSYQYTRISVNMSDVGTQKLPAIINDIEHKTKELFDTSYNVTITGSSITFLEGSKYIINGLKESIFWAFLLIAVCMLYLFRSFRILICSLLPNLIPLFVTAGVMGWVGVPLKPSTVLVFSVALGIAVDITIRFLVNYRQVLPEVNFDTQSAVRNTVRQTGLSIIYTSLVLTAGFIIFCGSSFGGTFALGWLTSLTLIVATITNLVLLPVLLLLFAGRKK